MKRWQLLVYFQLRFREIIKNVEETLHDSGDSLSLKSADFSKGKHRNAKGGFQCRG